MSKEKPSYSDWLSTVPPSRANDPRYDLEKAYNALDFDTLERWRTASDEDLQAGRYHLPSVIPSKEHVGGYDFLKRFDHPSLQKELDWYRGDSEDANRWRSSFDIDTSSDFYKYVPKPGVPMSAPFSHTIPEFDAEPIYITDENGYDVPALEGEARWPFPLPNSPFPSSTNSFSSSDVDSARDSASQILVDRLGDFGYYGHYNTRIPDSALSQVTSDILSTGDPSSVRDFYSSGDPYPRSPLGKALREASILTILPPFSTIPLGLSAGLIGALGFAPALLGTGLAGAAGVLSGYAGYRGGKLLSEKAADSGLAERVWNHFHPQPSE